MSSAESTGPARSEFRVDGPTLALLRRRASWDRGTLANQAGLAAATLSMAERGHVGLSVDKLARESFALVVPVDDLIVASVISDAS